MARVAMSSKGPRVVGAADISGEDGEVCHRPPEVHADILVYTPAELEQMAAEGNPLIAKALGEDVGNVQPGNRARRQIALSGNSPGIQREASSAGKAMCNAPRVLSEVSTPRSIRAETTRLAWRSLVPRRPATSPRGSSPR